jgi:hypothetical protein
MRGNIMRGRNLTKILGLSLLVAVGVMAVSASAAQAKWLLLKNGASTNTLDLVIQGLLGELLVPNLGLAIHCTGASGTASITSSGATATGSATVVFEGCTVLNNPKCTILGEEGVPATEGKIIAGGKGELGMNGAEEVLVKAKGEPFTTFYFMGAFCTLPEETEVKGLALLTLLEALKDLKTHLVHVDEGHAPGTGATELFYGNEPAEIHGALLAGGVHEPAGEAHVTEKNGATWAIHLVEL